MIKVTTVEFIGRNATSDRWGERRSWHHIHSMITGKAYFLETYGYLRDKFYAWPINAVGEMGKREYREILEKRIAKSGLRDLEPEDRKLDCFGIEDFAGFGEVVQRIFTGPTGDFGLTTKDLAQPLLKEIEGALTLSVFSSKGVDRVGYTRDEHHTVYRSALMTSVSPDYGDLVRFFPHSSGDNNQTVAAQPTAQIQVARPDHFGSW